MPKAILALRSYPLAILMALVLFVCSFLIATSSIGISGGARGGEDQGSGLGGTGKAGGFNGDSGFGGTGGPSPFLGSNDAGGDTKPDSGEPQPVLESDLSSDSQLAPFLQQEQETARIPEEMRPLIELQRNPPQNPLDESTEPLLNILDDNNALPVRARRALETAEATNMNGVNGRVEGIQIVEPTLELHLEIPESLPADASTVEPYHMELAEQSPQPEPETGTEASAHDAASDSSAAPLTPEQLPVEEIADTGSEHETGAGTELQSIDDAARPSNPERIQRPELPPFQRMRPTVDRAAITPPRPSPMQI